MDFSISEESRMLVDTVRRFVQEKVQPLEGEVEKLGRIPDEKLTALKSEAKALGLYAMNMPEDVGGGAYTPLAICLAAGRSGQTWDAVVGWGGGGRGTVVVRTGSMGGGTSLYKK